MIESRWCPQCEAENLPQRHFCRLCGCSLEHRCLLCGFVNMVGDRFCGGCGEPLVDADGQPLVAVSDETADGTSYALPAALADAEGALASAEIDARQNRLTTIVKADLSGFTAMSELLGDPEEITVIMNQVFDPLVACVRRYRGYIDNYAGDMIISFFGSPSTLEDGAERAVRAALEMRDEVQRLNGRNISHGVELGISTGIATGYGLWSEVGFGGSSKKTLSGELGDYAALLEKYADRGTVGLCPDTQVRVRHVIPCEELEQRVHRPGEDDELPMFYAGTPGPRAGWAETVADDAPLCGQEELRRVLAAAWMGAECGHARILHLYGEAGVGKSRLLSELASLVRGADCPVYAAAGRPLSEALGDDWQRDLRHAMLSAAGIDDDDTEARAAWLSSLGLSPRNREAIDWLRATSAQGPCLVILDGLDWLSEGPGELVRGLAGTSALVAVASRRAGAVRAWGLPDELVDAHGVPLLRLHDLAELATWRLGKLAPTTVDWLWRWSEGNPRYVREFGEWALEHGLDGLGPAVQPHWLPWRVQEYSDAALDALGETDRAVLMACAVAADDETLAFEPALAGYLVAVPEWPASLQRLERNGLLRREGEPPRLIFRHRALRFTALARLVDSVRAALEERLQQATALLTGA